MTHVDQLDEPDTTREALTRLLDVWGFDYEGDLEDFLIANRPAVLRALGSEYVWMVGHERFLTEKAARAYHRASPSNPDGSPVRIRRQLVTEWEDVTDERR